MAILRQAVDVFQKLLLCIRRLPTFTTNRRESLALWAGMTGGVLVVVNILDTKGI